MCQLLCQMHGVNWYFCNLFATTGWYVSSNGILSSTTSLNTAWSVSSARLANAQVEGISFQWHNDVNHVLKSRLSNGALSRRVNSSPLMSIFLCRLAFQSNVNSNVFWFPYHKWPANFFIFLCHGFASLLEMIRHQLRASSPNSNARFIPTGELSRIQNPP